MGESRTPKKKSLDKLSRGEKRTYISQGEIPRRTLEEAIALGVALSENFNGSAAPHELAIAMNLSPTSSFWQQVTGAALAYGITDGGCNAAVIHLATIGERIINPLEDGDGEIAKRDAALLPKILRLFFEKYDRGKFPKAPIGENVLVSMGVPQTRAKSVFEIASKNGVFAGLIYQTKSGPYVALQSTKKKIEDLDGQTAEEEDRIPTGQLDTSPAPVNPPLAKNRSRVFITHGKDKQIVGQLKEILTFGKFEPVVAVEHETVSKPVPEKVMEDMRSCFAAVIHVEAEEELFDPTGAKLQKINDNVL